MGEKIAVGGLNTELATECPFKDETLGVDESETENYPKDDLAEQENDGGILGKNLGEGSPGRSGTWNGNPPPAYKSTRQDTRRSRIRVMVPGTKSLPDGIYGFTVAAHHLIPGEASLAASLLKPFMTEGDSVEVETINGRKTKRIRKHIGYNVNGSHNGVWLPGNYYIRASTSPHKGKTWSELAEDPWCLHYVAATTHAAGGQFHDAHTQYSSAVEDLLNKIADLLSIHECETCKPEDINPPVRIKERLYGLSTYFRTQVQGHPATWKRSWFTSDRWRESAFHGGRPSGEFMAAYERASAVSLPTTPEEETV